MGWTSVQIDETPWPVVLDLLSYWGKHPPVHVMVKAYLYGDKDDRAVTPTSEAELAAGIVGF